MGEAEDAVQDRWRPVHQDWRDVEHRHLLGSRKLPIHSPRRLRRGERTTITGDLIYLCLAAFVVWGRFGPEFFTG
ncbi:hypothetical protein ACFWVP_05825 [Streptomyces sp. NPDC058637]|uniref:hypothetical protein n=1 Tax=Streptomyces sp. NPDC058637 TaxID=3346569 RepID=UPI003655C568